MIFATPTGRNGSKLAPRRSQDGPKISQDAPKTAQEAPKTPQDASKMLWEPFWCRFGVEFGPRSLLNSLVFLWFL